MAESYKLYCLDGSDHIVRALWIEADGDEDALKQARDMKLSCHAELWLRSRKVGRISAGGGRSSSRAPGQQPSQPGQ